MTTIQQWLKRKYRNKNEVKEISINSYKEVLKFKKKTIDLVSGGSLTISDYPNLEKVKIPNGFLLSKIDNLTIVNCPKLSKLSLTQSNIKNIDLSNCPNLTSLYLPNNQLTNVDFLATLPQPEKLEELIIANNNIQTTTLNFLTKFPNLKVALLGIDQKYWKDEQKCNKFYGSLKPLQNLTKLEGLCICETDIDSGLEYLPDSLVKKNKEIINSNDPNLENDFACQPIRPDAKVQAISDQLRPFNYDLEAWMLANNLNRDEKLTETESELSDSENEPIKSKNLTQTTILDNYWWEKSKFSLFIGGAIITMALVINYFFKKLQF